MSEKSTRELTDDDFDFDQAPDPADVDPAVVGQATSNGHVPTAVEMLRERGEDPAARARPPAARPSANGRAAGGPHTWESLTKASLDNMQDSSNCARLLRAAGGDLVVVCPDSTSSTQTRIFAIDSRGMLSASAAGSWLIEAGRTVVKEAYTRGLSRADFVAITGHARRLQDAKAADHIEHQMLAVMYDLEGHGLQHDAQVVESSEVDHDLGVAGTPGGVLDLHTGEILTPADARKKLVKSRIPDLFNPLAQHEWVDDTLPPLDECHRAMDEGDPWPLYRAEVLAYCMTNPPRRQMMLELCAAGSGKSTFVNALQRGWGPYVMSIRSVALMEPDRREAGSQSHNGDLRHLMAPARLAFAQEWAGAANIQLLKAVSGGDAIPYRRIREEDTIGQPTAHVWIQGNDDPAVGNSLGLADDDDSGDAMRDRVRLLHRERRRNLGLADDARVVNYGADHDERTPGDARRFRQAVVARVVQYCVAGAGREFPGTLETQGELLERRQAAELPGHILWLRRAVVPEPHGKLVLRDLLKAYEEQAADEDQPLGLSANRWEGKLSIVTELRKAVRGIPKSKRVRLAGGQQVSVILGWAICETE